MNRRIILLAGILLAGLMAYFIISELSVAKAFRHDSKPNNLKFDKELWARGNRRERGQMVQYLQDSIGLLGKTRSEIKTLIGVPDDTNTITGSEYISSISYRVDLGHAFIYDMMVYFDSTDRAKYVKIDD